MVHITLADDSVRTYPSSDITPFDVAKDIGEAFSKKILSADLDGVQVELSTRICKDAKIKFYTWEDAVGKKAFWHSSAHVLAQSILDLFPTARLTIGPAIEEGFYYDVDLGEEVFSENDFPRIEQRMIENARKKSQFKLYSVSKDQALSYYKDNPYKRELIQGLEDGSITFCSHDEFKDLCRGGHLPDTSFIKAVKLLNTAGAYWRGNEKNKQLVRIYGISFPSQKDLAEYLHRREEAKKRDHRKLGKELKLFAFSKLVGLGLPLWLPKGAILRKKLENFLTAAQKKAGYEMVVTPHIGHRELYVSSGHWAKYGEDSFRPIGTPHDGEEFLLKPMNCPHHCEIYNAEQWSYRDLPKRFAEFGTVYRYEQSGELHGLTRVRGFTQDDAHIFCTPDQLLDEFKKVIDLVFYVFSSLGFREYKTQISLRDARHPEKYIGSAEHWEKAQEAIIKAVHEKGLDAEIAYGEAAFYGPKLDFMIKDALGRSWQLGTIQVDYNLPERFNLTYKGADNQLHRPVMIHRAPFGSLERFIAVLIEHTGGDFPFWLAPIQVIILPIGEKHVVYAKKVLNLLLEASIEAVVDERNEKAGKKIREAEVEKIPYMIIVGDKEQVSQTVSVRKRKEGDIGIFAIPALLERLSSENIYVTEKI